MATRIKNEVVDIIWNGAAVSGILDGEEIRWTFHSKDKAFLTLFAEGMVSSFTYLGSDSRYYEHRKFQLTVQEFVKELIKARRSPTADTNNTIRPVTRHRGISAR